MNITPQAAGNKTPRDSNGTTMKIKMATCLWIIFLISGCSFDSTFFPLDERADDKVFPNQQAINLISADGENIAHVFIQPQSEAKATIFVFQGSGSKVSNWLTILKPLVDDGYQIFLMDYRGFGNSEGEASHLQVANDAHKAFSHLLNLDEVKNKKMLVLG